jgi:K+-transporting ATPase KdpF subunit
VREAEMILDLLAGAACVALIGYLLYSIARPERF